MYNVKRPRRIHEEDEDDLMEFQEEFLRQQTQPSVKVVKKDKDKTEFSKSSEKIIPVDDSIDIDKIETPISVLADFITEKTIDLERVKLPDGNLLPRIEKIDQKEIEDFDKQKIKKKSLFAQRLEQQGKLKNFHELKLEENNVKLDKLVEKKDSLFPKSHIITGDGLTGPQDVERIHQENIEKLSKMSKEEILQERQKLLDTLDPKIIALIRKRGNKSANLELNQVQSNEQSTKLEAKSLNAGDIPFKPDKKWLNMNKIEYEKLEWMKDVKTKDENSVKARFDFNGKLINPDDNDKIPSTMALHHHGNEPEQAGYTIDELYYLTRSQFNQQRFVALKCLGNIIENCHLGEYRFQLKDPMLLNQLIESGLIFLLRSALDNQIESIIAITLKAFKNLLQPDKQEKILDNAFNSFFNSYQCSALNPFTKLNSEEIKELNDLEYVKLDTVKALFRMNLMERFIYLIDYFKLSSPNSIEFILEILIRITRHSAESCYELNEKHQSLISTIIKNFIPLNWNLNQENVVTNDFLGEFSEEKSNESSQNVYNRPYKSAIKLVRLLCQSSRSIAMCLYKNYDFKSIIIRYLTLNGENNLEIKVEIINLLKVLTIFDITNDCLTDGYELLLREFTFLITNDQNSSILLLEAYLSLFNSLILKLNRPNYVFNSKLCSNVFDLVLKFLKISQLSKSEHLNAISQALAYLTSYLQLSNTSTNENFKKLDLCNSIFKNEYLNLVNSISKDIELDQYTKYLLDLSLILNTESTDMIKYNNLTYLPTYLMPVALNNLYIPIFNFFISLLRLLIQTFQFKCDNLNDKLSICKRFLTNSYVKSYLRNAFLIQKENQMTVNSDDNCYLIKYENYFAYNCIKLALNIYNYQDISTINEEDAYFYHIISLNLIKRFKNGDEFYIHDLITNSIFNLNLWSHLNTKNENQNRINLIKKFQNLNIKKEDNSKGKIIITASGNKIASLKTESDIQQLEQNLYENLNHLKLNYINNLFNTNANTRFNLDRSCLLNGIIKPDSSVVAYETLFTSRYKEICVFNNDWVYIPIMAIIQQNQNLKTKQMHEIEIANVKNCEIILNTLKFIYLCEIYRPEYMKQIPSIIRLVNLLNIYLTDTSIYLDKNIQLYLYLLLIHYVNTQDVEKLQFNVKIPGIMSFYDYYQNLLKNFDAESFGDALFSHFILIPIQQYCPIELRYLLWSEYLHVFKFIRFDLNNEFLLSFETFIQPRETDFKMIQFYAHALLNEYNYSLIEYSQFAYLIAVRHVNAYLFDQNLLMNEENEVGFKKQLFKQFQSLQNEELKKDVFLFKTVTKEKNIEYYDVLPDIRQKWFQKMIE